MCQKALATLELDLDKFDNLADEYDEIELALEVVRSTVDVKALRRLLACFNEVIDNLRLNLEFVLEDRAE